MEAPQSAPAWPGLLWAALGGLACASVAPLEPNLLEEGTLVHAAQRMVAGEKLFAEIGSFTGPFPFEVLAAAFRVCGDSLWVARGAIVVLHAAATAAAWGIGRRAAGPPGGHAAAACVASSAVLLFPFLSFYFYATIGVGLASIACYTAVRGVSSRPWAAATGALVACIALSKQTLGVALAASFLVSILACARRGERIRMASSVALGGAAVALFTCTYYAWNQQLGAMFYWIVEIPFSMSETFGSPYMNLWPLGEFAPAILERWPLYVPWLYGVETSVFKQACPWWLVITTQLCFALPPLAIAATLLLRLRRPLPAAVWIHFATCVGVATNLVPRADWGHLAFVLPSAAVQLALVAACIESGPIRRRRTHGVAILVGALALACAASGVRLYGFAEPPNLGPRVPLRPVSTLARSPAIARVVSYLREHARPGEPIYVTRGEPLIYYATDTTNPAPFSYAIPGFRELQEGPTLTALRDVRFVVMSEFDQPFAPSYSEELPGVHAYLERHFRVPEEFLGKDSDWILVLERGPDRGPTFLDLVSASPNARRWVRDQQGALRPWPRSLPKAAVRQNRRLLPFWLAPRGGGIDFDVEVPPGAVFQADVGYAELWTPEHTWEHPALARLEVAIDAGDGFETLHSQRVFNPPEKGQRVQVPVIDAGRRWSPIEVDLAPYAGHEVTLRLELVLEVALTYRSLGWFGSPRIALTEPGEGGSPAPR